jgi:hypothetical protein
VPRARLFGADSVAPPRYKLPSVFLTGDIPGDELDDEEDDDDDDRRESPGPVGPVELGTPS